MSIHPRAERLVTELLKVTFTKPSDSAVEVTFNIVLQNRDDILIVANRDKFAPSVTESPLLVAILNNLYPSENPTHRDIAFVEVATRRIVIYHNSSITPQRVRDLVFAAVCSYYDDLDIESHLELAR